MLKVAFEAEGAPVALVTGAAGAIGGAVAGALHRAGATVVAVDIEAPGVMRDHGSSFEACACDVSSEAAVAALAARVGETCGRLDILVHAAGIAGGGPLAGTSTADWQAVIDANLTSAFLLCRAFRPLLAASAGSVVLVGSSNGVNGGSALSGAAYAVAKAGLHNLVRYLAKEWASDRVRVNAVAPGPVTTPMVERLGETVRADLARAIPLGREGTPEEVAANILFLASDGAAWQTGTVVNISGGLVL